MAKPNRENFKDEETAQEAHQARSDIERVNQLRSLRDILKDERVRTFLYRMMAKAGMFTDHFSTNAAIMGRNCGFAAMGHAIYAEIVESSPEAWILMQQEALQRQRDEDAWALIEEQERSAQASSPE